MPEREEGRELTFGERPGRPGKHRSDDSEHNQRGETSRILIYRLGSIGDFIIALPCLHLIRKRFPAAHITLLTNRPRDHQTSDARSVLDGSGLIDSYITYPSATRNPYALGRLAAAIRSFRPQLFVYLVSHPTFRRVLRDYAFCRFSGAERMVGFPFDRERRVSFRRTEESELWEPEAHRLARCIAALGPAETRRAESWDLRLSAEERRQADAILEAAAPRATHGMRLIGLSIGTKQKINDWGDANWRAVLDGLGSAGPGTGMGLVLIGAAHERQRSESLARGWPGPVLNCCGQASPRISAAILRRVSLFLCHDSGPMHLAAAMGTRCVAVFSRKNHPGIWYPTGSGHSILYPPYGAEFINAIRPAEVIEATRGMLAPAVRAAGAL